ncbi:fungal-specific transcription factor domain-containing protein [Thelephora terrestris]|uniref:Fungal-specific transcription factor domain-containing protein n=1 Tax=Thelephora terrestris TaxID=56493 RepID=A0A9P6H482_9AGAM|nr:fungal-specific transcription factor domain-containing protein [Thelephora terrestris]
MPDGRCATCITYSVECTYNDLPKRSTPKGYTQILEARLAKVEQLVQKYSYLDTLGSPWSSTTHGHTNGNNSSSEDEAKAQPKLSPLPARAYSKPPDIDPLCPPEEEATYSDDEFATVDDTSPSKGPVEGSHENARFYGKSSLVVLAHKLVNERREQTGARFMPKLRKQFWAVPDWMTSILESPPIQFEYPDTDLLRHLVDCYFDNLNILLPLLHRPSFMRSIEEGLHQVDHNFGATVLAVCAIGCRYTDDPRVTYEITTSTSCTAWRLFSQLHKLKKVNYLPHSLYEAQMYPLAALFLEGYSPPETPWVLIGVGLRVMQDNGVHRKFFSEKQTLENELWKRAFWVLVVLDRSFSTLLGRPCALQDEDFDADPPLPCNDEDLGESGLDSPAQSPTEMCSFIALTKLTQILAFALRTLYSTKNSRVVLGFVGKQWEQRILVTLDSALNKWVDIVPEHLRQGSGSVQKNRTYRIQSAFLWCQFYELQLHVHRVFALRNPPDPELTASSMIICKSAAKQCIGIVESSKDLLLTPLATHVFIKPMFDACVFLLLVFWRKKAIDYNSREYRAIEFVTEMGNTFHRWRTSLCLRSILGVLRATIDGPYMGWKPTFEDWDRMKACLVFYVDKDGLISSAENGRGAHRTFQDKDEYGDRNASFNSPGKTYPLERPRGNTDSGAPRPTFRADGPAGYGAIQPGDLPPAVFFANNPGLCESSAMLSSSGYSSPDETNGINGRRMTGDPSSILPMGLMIYNDLMMDIDGTARFLGQDFQDSVLFSSPSTPSSPPAGYHPDQGSGPQLPSTMQGSWDRAFYDNFLDQITKQAT